MDNGFTVKQPGHIMKKLTYAEMLPLIQAITIVDPLGEWDRVNCVYNTCKRSPTAFIRKGEKEVVVSAEDGCYFADYYGHGGMWIHPVLEKFAADHGCFWEWESPGAIGLYYM